VVKLQFFLLQAVEEIFILGIPIPQVLNWYRPELRLLLQFLLQVQRIM
jgi:hypothetical protein